MNVRFAGIKNLQFAAAAAETAEYYLLELEQPSFGSKLTGMNSACLEASVSVYIICYLRQDPNSGLSLESRHWCKLKNSSLLKLKDITTERYHEG